jgi:hypothetical protein
MLDRSRLQNLAVVLVLYLFSAAGSSAQTLPDYTISGQVNDEYGQPTAEVRVCAHPHDYSTVRMQPCGRSNAAGNFVIRTGRAARYRIYADKSSAGYFPQQLPFFKHPAESIPEVVLNEETRTAMVSVRLPPKNGELVGKVTDASTGRPVDNAHISVCQAADKTKCWGSNAKSATGEFRLLAAHVPFTFQLFAAGYETWSGLNGSEIHQSIYIPSGSRMEVLVYLKRRPDSVNRALSEAEKQPVINLPAPMQVSPDDAAEFDFYPRKTILRWEGVVGANSYRIEIDYCDGRVRGRRSCVDPQPHYIERNNPAKTRATSYEFNFVGAQPGRWRVWAIDEKGEEGFKSPWRTFFYLQ